MSRTTAVGARIPHPAAEERDRPAGLGGEFHSVLDSTVPATIQREIAMLKELFSSRIDGMDRAIILLQANADKSQSVNVVEHMSLSLKELHEEKFNSIEVQFRERDTRTEQTSRDSKVAVDAALQAAKEAVGEQNKSSALAIAKSEAATTKQIDQMTTLLQAALKAIDDKFSDLKDRITSIEGRALGVVTTEKRMGEGWGLVFGGIMAIIAIMVFVLSIVKPGVLK